MLELIMNMIEALLVGVILVAFVLLISFLGSILISNVGIRYAEKKNESYLNAVTELLPGTNCKECGRENCRQFADCLLCKEASPDSCVHCGEEAKEKIYQIIDEANPEFHELPTNLRKRKKMLRLRNSRDEEEETD